MYVLRNVPSSSFVFTHQLWATAPATTLYFTYCLCVQVGSFVSISILYSTLYCTNNKDLRVNKASRFGDPNIIHTEVTEIYICRNFLVSLLSYIRLFVNSGLFFIQLFVLQIILFKRLYMKTTRMVK